MNNPYQQQNNNYQQVELQDKVTSASPHELINMLFKGAKIEIKSAIIKMQHNKLAEQGQHISKAIKIISGLKGSINSEAGSKLSDNLTQIYDYIMRTLLEANLEDDPKKLEHCYNQLNEVASAWEQIKPDTKSPVTKSS